MKLHYLVLFTALYLMACNRPNANKVEVSASQEASVAEVLDEKLVVDTTLSSLHWKGFKPGGSHRGVLSIKSGEIYFANEKLISGTFLLDMNAIVCEDLTDKEMNDKLVGHLKSPDFFNVAQFPEGKFTITAVEESARKDNGANIRINGNLELKGISKNIEFNAKVTKQDNLYKAESDTFSIDRTQWGINYASKNIFKDLKDKFINDDMEVCIVVVAKY